eukprot:TRINITY_DN2059_c0_g2_i6.p2 TRINITY_DN2059_c0_g2~~TRINITY_DN2059_c0_g2_i6.p2  ORF type:complete len:243 (-),score=45.39 TRINITY_DN2059_c0_g2_i6:396-1124(-)
MVNNITRSYQLLSSSYPTLMTQHKRELYQYVFSTMLKRNPDANASVELSDIEVVFLDKIFNELCVKESEKSASSLISIVNGQELSILSKLSSWIGKIICLLSETAIFRLWNSGRFFGFCTKADAELLLMYCQPQTVLIRFEECPSKPVRMIATYRFENRFYHLSIHTSKKKECKTKSMPNRKMERIIFSLVSFQDDENQDMRHNDLIFLLSRQLPIMHKSGLDMPWGLYQRSHVIQDLRSFI